MSEFGWGRYSGFFFYSYVNGEKHREGPWKTRAAAEDAASCWGNNAGRVFQIERPVVL